MNRPNLHFSPIRGTIPEKLQGVVVMIGWIRTNRGKKRDTHYVVIPWSRVDGSGRNRNWQLKFDEQGFRFESRAHAKQTLDYFRVLIKQGHFNPLDWIEAKPHGFEKLARIYFEDQKEAVAKGDLSPSTPVYKERYMRLYYLPFFKGRDVKHIISLDLKRFYSQLPATLKKAKARLNVMAQLENFFGWCKEQQVIKGEIPRYTDMAKLRALGNEQRPKPKETTHMMVGADFERAIGQMQPGDRGI